jgi:predicted nucleic acid-binding protein
MKSFFDTSVLVAAMLEDHLHHERSFSLFANANPSTGCCAAHSLAEFYATLTRLPGRFRVSGDQVALMLESMEDRLEVVSLNAREYGSAIRAAATAGIVGGTIYDMLLARCALKAQAMTIFTWNVAHFQRLGGEVAARVRTP